MKDHDRKHFEQYYNHQQRYYKPTYAPSFASTLSTTLLQSLVTVVCFLIFAAFAWPLVTGQTQTYRKYAHGIQAMASRVTFGMIRRPMPGGFGNDGGMNNVFGLANTARTLGTDTLQKGIGGIRSIVKGSSNDGPAGLGNWDNSCYQNSIIQGFASLRSFPQFLQRVVSKGGEDAAMNAALLGMVGRLNDASNDGKELWLPKELKTMSTFQQQDAQEYFSKVLDIVDKEATAVARKELEKKGRTGLTDVLEEAWDDTIKDERVEAEEKEALRNPLEGLQAQRVSCKSCRYSDGLRLDPFTCLTVHLGSSTSLHDIRDCLDSFTALESIDGVSCPKCTLLSFRNKLENVMHSETASEAVKEHIRPRLNAVVQALADKDFSDEIVTKKCRIPKEQWVNSTKTKQAVIARPPRGLVIHLNRSMMNEYTQVLKNPAVVQFPARLDLEPWTLGKTHSSDTEAEMREIWSMNPSESMLPSLDDENDDHEMQRRGLASNAQYELKAVITHFGRHENGHYIAFRKHLTSATSEAGDKETVEKWYRLSDEDVSPINEEFVLSQGGVFMLFYERLATPSSSTSNPPSTALSVLSTSLLSSETKVEGWDVPLPKISDAELDFMLMEDVCAKARLSENWTPPSPPMSRYGSQTQTHSRRSMRPTLERVETSRPEGALGPERPSVGDILDKGRDEGKAATTIGVAEVQEEMVDEEIKAEAEAEAEAEPVINIRMRTSNLLGDDKHRSHPSNESLRLGARMVSAS